MREWAASISFHWGYHLIIRGNQSHIRSLSWQTSPVSNTDIPLPFQKIITQTREFLLHGKAFPRVSRDLFSLQQVSAFTQKVYSVLLESHPGARFTYANLAELAGSPGAARSVGRAMSQNPFPVLIPCHRVVGLHNPHAYTPDARLKISLHRLEDKLK